MLLALMDPCCCNNQVEVEPHLRVYGEEKRQSLYHKRWKELICHLPSPIEHMAGASNIGHHPLPTSPMLHGAILCQLSFFYSNKVFLSKLFILSHIYLYKNVRGSRMLCNLFWAINPHHLEWLCTKYIMEYLEERGQLYNHTPSVVSLVDKPSTTVSILFYFLFLVLLFIQFLKMSILACSSDYNEIP